MSIHYTSFNFCHQFHQVDSFVLFNHRKSAIRWGKKLLFKFTDDEIQNFVHLLWHICAYHCDGVKSNNVELSILFCWKRNMKLPVILVFPIQDLLTYSLPQVQIQQTKSNILISDVSELHTFKKCCNFQTEWVSEK